MINDKADVKREQSRKAMARLLQRRHEAGLKRVTFWATPEVQELLELLQQDHPTRDDLMNRIVRRYGDGIQNSIHNAKGRSDPDG